MHYIKILNLMGGIGLILLGMKLMTSGLKMVAGNALRTLLANWTNTPVRGILSGFFITSAVQSSSAVTVAAIGFVNAGLITLTQAIWVVYGSNIGTTTTAWIVAFLGLKINVKILAMPFIALGMFLWLTGKETRRSAVGEVFAGFGLFFLGIDAMQAAFQGMESVIPMSAVSGTGIWGKLIIVVIGFVLTFLMQSSSAAMALILSATAEGFIPLSAAAAAVIGANVGTTSTGIFAVIGATSNAKRVATAHVLFNCLTGVVAFAILPVMLGLIVGLRNWLHLPVDPPAVLAIFHTVFNLLGVFLMWFFTRRMITRLEMLFTTYEENESKPQFIDTTILATPGLALNALVNEVRRIGVIAARIALLALAHQKRPTGSLKKDNAVLDNLQTAVAHFAVGLRKQHLSTEASTHLPEILRISQDFNVTADLALKADMVWKTLSMPEKENFPQKMNAYEKSIIELLTDAKTENIRSEKIIRQIDQLKEQSENMKKAVLFAGSFDILSVDQMVGFLEYINTLEDMALQYIKGLTHLSGLPAAILQDSVSDGSLQMAAL